MPTPDVTPELPPATWRAILALLGRMPQAGLSRTFGRVADTKVPRALRRLVLGSFARAVGMDLSEAEFPLEEYESMNHLFVRRLRHGARSWPGDPLVAGSPVDGITGQMGTTSEGRLLQAKGRWYSAADLLGDPAEAERFDGGAYLTIYLSPRHYHRIHTPTSGRIARATHIPGALLPVNGPAVSHVQDLFPRNERVVCYVDGPLGRIAVVAVGAYNVGRISAAFDPGWNAPPAGSGWVTNRPAPGLRDRSYDPPVTLSTGDEIMAFHLGSTVVLLFEAGRADLGGGIRVGQELRLGEPIARAVG